MNSAQKAQDLITKLEVLGVELTEQSYLIKASAIKKIIGPWALVK